MNTEFSRQVGDYLVTREAREQRRKYIRDILIGAACFVALLVAATWPTNAHALELDQQGCQGFAVWAHDIQLMRDVGADKEKVRAYLESQKAEIPYFTLLLKALDGLWKDQSDKTAIAQWIYQDCIKRRGQYGTDV